MTEELKPHQIAQLVNKLRDIATKYHAHGCLRELISREVNAALTQRPAEQTEREAFEEWYAEDANKQTGKPGWFTPKSIAELRDGDGYGEHRVMLNGKWEGWQARAAMLAAAQAKGGGQ